MPQTDDFEAAVEEAGDDAGAGNVARGVAAGSRALHRGGDVRPGGGHLKAAGYELTISRSILPGLK